MRYLDVTKGLNKIGRLGENEHRTLRFGETAEDLAMYPNATVAVLHKRSGDAVAYPVPPSQVQIQSGVVCWTVMSGDLAMKGRGKVEVNIYQGNVIAKSYIYDTFVDDALDGSGDAPDQIRTFVQEVTEQANRAEAAAELLENPGAEAITLAPGTPATAEYDDGTFRFGIPQGAKGDPGDPGEPGQDYVITPEDYDEIATEVANRRAIQDKVDAAEDAADLARGYAEGKHLDGTDNTSLIGNNAKEYARQAAASADLAQRTVDDAVRNIENTGAEQAQAVEDKGAEVLDSIPADYQEIADAIDAAPDEVTAAALIAVLENGNAWLDGVLNVAGDLIEHMPQDETIQRTVVLLAMGNDRLETICDGVEA